MSAGTCLSWTSFEIEGGGRDSCSNLWNSLWKSRILLLWFVWIYLKIDDCVISWLLLKISERILPFERPKQPGLALSIFGALGKNLLRVPFCITSVFKCRSGDLCPKDSERRTSRCTVKKICPRVEIILSSQLRLLSFITLFWMNQKCGCDLGTQTVTAIMDEDLSWGKEEGCVSIGSDTEITF